MHTSVLLQEAVEQLVTDTSGCYVDATLGRGGHSAAILTRLSATARLVAIDRDPEAVAWGRTLFGDDRRVSVVHSGFDRLRELLSGLGIPAVNGVLLDLGVSSPQLDDPRRGFSFLRDGPLDMRMDPGTGRSAAEWIASAPEAEIERVLREYGEERFARRMASAIVRERRVEPVTTTARLADIVTRANPAWERDKHPATRCFQAIRIFINSELEALGSVLRQARDALLPGGRLVVISFHSLEDRIVKRFIRDNARAAAAPGMPGATLRALSRAVRPGESEVAANPRARSAVLRVAERLAAGGAGA